jgi:uncharacterized repeat protein (TIGR03843 family)
MADQAAPSAADDSCSADGVHTEPIRDPVLQRRVLLDGDIAIEGRMPWSSNATFLCTMTLEQPHGGDPQRGQAIYKPLRGERPLWDFEPGLFRREVAAYELSEALGWGLVPPTVVRDGPLGEGSLQWFVDADHSQHYFTIYETRPDVHDRLRQFAVFDVLANNTDRKSGHILIDGADMLWGIDHGLCFAADFKLRTVVWDFGGDPIDQPILNAVATLISQTPTALADLLSPDEVDALIERARYVLEQPFLPIDESGRRYPWPLV